MNSERERLEKIASESWYSKGVNSLAIEYSASVFERYLIKGSILELGPAEGVMTEYFTQKYTDITVLEGSTNFSNILKNKFPDIKVINGLFEEFNPESQYDNIILGHVLEHVIDPISTLIRVCEWLSPNGRILAAVPNAFSVHRQAAVIMGMLRDEHDLNETDVHHGHRRVYDPISFKRDFHLANLRVIKFGSYWMKPLSNRQIEEQWTESMVNAFMILGEKYPEIAAEIYIVATK